MDANTTNHAEPRSSSLGRFRERVERELFRQVSGSSLALFRMAFGALLAWEVYVFLFDGWTKAFFIDPVHHFKYYGFSWVHPWPGNWMYAHFYALGISAVCIMLGLYYRVACVVFFLGFAQVFLIDQATYLNHFYLVVLLSGLFCCIPAHRKWSLDAKGSDDKTVPMWCLYCLRLQFGLVYFFAGLAKINPDWLHGEPFTTWMSHQTELPVIGPWLDSKEFCLMLCYGGLLLDLLAFPGLLWKRTRVLTSIALAVFHLTNVVIFHIGIFPWMMLASLGLFFAPDWPERLLGRTTLAPTVARRRSPAKRTLIMSALALYFAVQVLMPLRHWLYPGDVNWTEEGHRFAWRMKLRDKQVEAKFRAVNPRTGEEILVGPADYLNIFQWNKAKVRPDMLQQFAQIVAKDLRERGLGDFVVHADVSVSLNFGPSRPIIDPAVDLASVSRNLSPAPWILKNHDSDP